VRGVSIPAIRIRWWVVNAPPLIDDSSDRAPDLGWIRTRDVLPIPPRPDPTPSHLQAKSGGSKLLRVKADLERELEDLVPSCRRCGLDEPRITDLGVKPGHRGHREPAPHGEPAVT